MHRLILEEGNWGSEVSPKKCQAALEGFSPSTTLTTHVIKIYLQEFKTCCLIFMQVVLTISFSSRKKSFSAMMQIKKVSHNDGGCWGG